MRHYHIARLRRGAGLTITGDALRVDLESIAEDDHITDDAAFLAAVGPENFFYISGGGTFRLNGSHLLIVRRDESARVNPGRWSLFTGRADGPREWEEPWRIVRELFEEVDLSADGKRLRPTEAQLDPIIRDAYGPQTDEDFSPLPIRRAEVHCGRMVVSRGERVLTDMPAFYHVNSRNDINLLYVFDATLDLDSLVANDREHGPGRERVVAALDLQQMTVREVSAGGDRAERDASDLPMTEHLTALVRRLSSAH